MRIVEGKHLSKSKNKYIFDTGVLYLYFMGNKEAVSLLHEVNSGLSQGFTCETNTAELYYKTCEHSGQDVALLRYSSLRNSSVIIVQPDEYLSLHAGQLKSLHRNQISLVDAYVVSLAIYERGTLYTTDPRIANFQIVPTQLLHFE